MCLLKRRKGGPKSRAAFETLKKKCIFIPSDSFQFQVHIPLIHPFSYKNITIIFNMLYTLSSHSS